MESQTKIFNKSPSAFAHLDLNSCFASVEQQANPFLRFKPVAVTAYNADKGCVLASSYEAKKFGVKTGMRYHQAKKLCPNLISLVSDPPKYRFVHKQIKKLLENYCPSVTAKSIDEFLLDFTTFKSKNLNLKSLFWEIKQEIKKQVGDYLTVSVGLAPSAYLAKVASNLKKPDGLEEINFQNYLHVYSKLKLTDLTGINTKTDTRLNMVGIHNVLDLYQADTYKINEALHSIFSVYWYQRLRGYDAGLWDTTKIKSIGHTYTLPKASQSSEQTKAILAKLAEKVSLRLRKKSLSSQGIHLSLRYQNGTSHNQHLSFARAVFDSSDIFKLTKQLLDKFPKLPVRNLSLTCFKLSPINSLQLSLFEPIERKLDLNISLDKIKSRWGSFTIFPASMLGTSQHAPDAIGFGNIP